MKDRRRAPRYNIALEVEYEVKDTVGIMSKTYTINVSEVGMQLPLPRAVSPGRRLEIRLRLPYEEKELTVTGKVVWRQPIDSNLLPEENAGVEFLKMSSDDTVDLVNYIKSHTV